MMTSNEWQTVVETGKLLVRQWLLEEGVALTGVSGEVSRSTVNRFRLDLAGRIAKAITTARKEEREAAFKEAVRITETTATREDVITALKAAADTIS